MSEPEMSQPASVALSDLTGAKLLTGIDRFNENRKSYWDEVQSVEVCRIELDGVTYEIAEDPDDGYRSGHYGPTIVGHRIQNTFAPVPVVCTYVEQSEPGIVGSGKADTLQIANAETGAVILLIGTQDIDDYYPGYVCSFSAENIGLAKASA